MEELTITETAKNILSRFAIVNSETRPKPEISRNLNPNTIELCRTFLFTKAGEKGLVPKPEKAWNAASVLLAKYFAWKRESNSVTAFPKPKVGICFYGPCGSGKTVLAKTLVECIRQGTGASFVMTRSQTLTEEFSASDIGGIGYCLDSDLLIDDLGSERDGRSFGQIWGMSDFIKSRYDNAFTKSGALTVITTNLASPQEFSDRYGDAVKSRLHDMVDFIFVDSPDWREKNSQTKDRW